MNRLKHLQRPVIGHGLLGWASVLLCTACASEVRGPDDGFGGGMTSGNGTTAGPNTGQGPVTAAQSGANTVAATAVATTSPAASVATSSTGAPLPDDTIPPYFPTACPQALMWPIACLSVEYEDLIGLNPETGETCTIAHLDEPVTPNSLALVGDAVIVCNESAGNGPALARIDALTGDVTQTQHACYAVTDATDVLYAVDGPSEVVRAPTFDDLVQGNVTPTDITPFATRIVARNADLYASWHSTNELEHWDIPSESQLPNVTLQSFDDWILGIAPIDDGRIVIVSHEEIVIFSSTGERLSSIDWSNTSSGGLRCYTN